MPRKLVGLVVCAAALWLGALAPPGLAQETGGSMGGADFSDGGGGGGDSGSADAGSSSGSGSDATYSGGSSGGSSGGGSGGGSSGIMVLFLIVAVILVIQVLRRRSGGTKTEAISRRAGSGAGGSGPAMYLSVLVLGIDWHARRELQARLAALAARGLGGTAKGRATMLQEVVLALQRAELSWLYVGCEEAPGLSSAAAQSAFLGACNKARSRFHREVVRDAGGEVATAAAGPLARRADEGAGTVAVSLILVTRNRLFGQPDMTDAALIRNALSSRAAVAAHDLVAIEVVWSPAAEDDRMSSAELEQHYPELARIDPKSIAGRIFCAYCGGAFAMELLNCPHCGAAVERSA